MSSVEISANEPSTQLAVPLSTKVHGVAADIFLILLELPDCFGPESKRFSQHMAIRSGVYKGRPRLLSDGTSVRLGNQLGILDFDRRLPILDPNDNLVAYTRERFRQACKSMAVLASMCVRDRIEVEGIVAFGGISHIAGPLAERLGFDTFEITDPLKRVRAYLEGKTYTWIIAHRNQTWQKINRNFKAPREAFISREKVVSLYGNIR